MTRVLLKSIRVIQDNYKEFPEAVRWFIDNTSTVCATKKGRSRTYCLSGWSLRDEISESTAATFSYITSALNPADAPSRGKRLTKAVLERARSYVWKRGGRGSLGLATPVRAR